MRYFRVSVVLAAAVAVCLVASPASAQHRRGGGGGHIGGRSGVVVGRAAPRGFFPRTYIAPRIISPRVLGIAPYRPYYYRYRPGLTVGFYAGFGYGYPYGYYGYPGYAYGYPGYGYYGPSYGYPLPPAGYVVAQSGVAYGGVRIQGAPKEAQVFADGYYMGVVEDFDGPVNHLNLPAGAHRIEIRLEGYQPIAFDVNVQPGQTITYHADYR